MRITIAFLWLFLVALPPVFAVEPVRVGLSPVFFYNDPSLLADWKGYLQTRLGREVEFVRRSRYREMLDLVRGGGVDFAWICTKPYMDHRAAALFTMEGTEAGKHILDHLYLDRFASPPAGLYDSARQLVHVDGDSLPGK